MANLSRNFIAGRMNKSVDERLIPNGEYIDALNIRMGSTELSEIGVIENTTGNDQLTVLKFLNEPLSNDAVCIGAYEDGARETLYWFVHDSNNPLSATTNKVDMIVSFNTKTSALTYHVISEYEAGGSGTTLNFNPKYLVNAVNMVDDLLFFTDNYNPPRFINIKKSYLQPSAGVDQITAEELMVIKKFPPEAPEVTPFINPSASSEDSFMKDRFICFAYRYRYDDNQYSATSQFTQPVFIPNQFGFAPDSFLNSGMQNQATNAVIKFNSGGPLVKGIDLLFKEASSNIIRVIEKLDKASMGYGNNTVYTYTFGDSKIFTILPDYEILRLYDNVPRLANAQTIMGNRLVYGNYVEGYDMVDLNGLAVNLQYTTELISEDINVYDLTSYTLSSNYTIDGPVTVPGSSLVVDLAGYVSELKEGAIISIDFKLAHDQFSNGSLPEQTDSMTASFSYTLPQDFPDVTSLVNSNGFQIAIGTAANIQSVQNCDNGDTFTDSFNCAVPQNLGTYSKYESGITAPDQPISVTPAASPNTAMLIQFPAMAFVDNVSAPTDYVYEYYKITSAEATLQNISTTTSLHSNRGYEVGIIYMDEFGRSTTALVSKNNTQFIDCGLSSFKNSIRVTIPTSQRAPYWASRYKFCIKTDRENYETIYSNIFFPSPDDNTVWFLVDGENAKKVQEGDRLIVKADTSGPLSGCAFATVLEKKVQSNDFITIPGGGFVPGGVYIKILPNNFNTVKDPNAYVDLGSYTVTAQGSYDTYPLMVYTVSYPDNSQIDIPAGSRVRLYIRLYRRGPGSGDRACERREYTLDKTIISSNSHASFKDFFVDENVKDILNDGVQNNGVGSCPITNYYNPSVLIGPTQTSTSCSPGNYFPCPVDVSKCTATYRFNVDPVTQKQTLMVAGGVWACGFTSNREAKITMHIEIQRAEDLIIFETQPSDSLPDVFYESSQSFSIDSSGQHSGNVQSQNFLLNSPAIIDTDFFNCYSFGNGAESYKILDSAAGKHFNIGNRVTITSNQDYMEVDRYADLTYSGVYNDESNVNKLNEFNLGLLNFKPLENSFGSIEVLYGRETDILVLQEDKISYVLAGKNLISDSTGGGTISSVPEVLGTQIARLEEYGISKNPESFTSYGYDKYFTDQKRGAVIKLTGSSYSNDQLNVVSENGMRTWFRDLFISNPDTQKLGGYDPYMNEYVLSSNNNDLPVDDICVDCNNQQTLQIQAPNPGVMTLAAELCFNYGNTIGDVTIDILYTQNDPLANNPIIVTSIYNGLEYGTGPIFTNATIVFPKDLINVTQGFINIEVEQYSEVTIQVSCPGANSLKVVQVCVSSIAKAGQFIHNEYNYIDGVYISPTLSSSVQMSSNPLQPVVSYYSMISGYQGDSFIPTDGSNVTMNANKIGFDDFQFNPSADTFKFLRSSTEYQNTPGDITLLLAAAADATPIDLSGAPNLYSASFTMPAAPPTDEYLYLIWDYRSGTQQELCYSNVSADDACCDCDCGEECPTYEVVAVVGGTGGSYFYNTCPGFELGGLLSSGESVILCAQEGTLSATGDVTVTRIQCGCSSYDPTPTTYDFLGPFYTGYTNPYQETISYSTANLQAAICENLNPLPGTTFNFNTYYFQLGDFVSAGTQIYSDTSGTPSNVTGIFIYAPFTAIFPDDIEDCFVVSVVNGIIAGVVPTTYYITNC